MKIILISLLCCIPILLPAQEQADKLDAWAQEMARIDSSLQKERLKDGERIKIMERKISCMDSMIMLLDDRCQQYAKSKASLERKIKIFNFFFCTDSTVYTTAYIHIDNTANYPPAFREFYQLVSEMRSINNELTNVKSIIKDVDTNPSTAGLSKETKTDIIREKTENKLLDLESRIIALKERKMDVLSEEQISFFEDLKGRYNHCIDIIYNNSNSEEP